MDNGLLYVLNTVTKCVSQVNTDSSSAKRYRNDTKMKIFTDKAKASAAQRKLKK